MACEFDHARRRKPVAGLKLLHRCDERGVVLLGYAHADEVAADLEPPMQRHDFGPGAAGVHRRGRNHRPAAVRHDGAVFRDRRLGRGDIGFSERWRAERRIEDPSARGRIALLRRELIAVKSLRSWLLRAALATAEQSAPEQTRSTVAARNPRRLDWPVGLSSRRTSRRSMARRCS